MRKNSVMEKLKWSRLESMVNRYVRLNLSKDMVIRGFLLKDKKGQYYIMVDLERGPKIPIMSHITYQVELEENP